MSGVMQGELVAARSPGAISGGGAGRPGPPGGRRPVRRVPRRPRETTVADIATAAACLFSAVSLSWLLFARVVDGTGWLGFALFAYVVFVVMYGVATFDRLGWLVTKDRLATLLVTTGAVFLFVPLVWLVGYVVVRGAASLRPGFVLRDMQGVSPLDPATAGGGLHAIIGTVQQVGLALLVSLPLGLATAVFLNESASRWRRPVRIVIDSMSGLPSVVAGLFIFAVFILPNQGQNALLSYNGFMGALALSMIMLPPITRTVEVVLRLVPDGLREASLALGASRVRTVWSIVIPTARTGVTTAVVLGLARAVGETAPLLFTAFGSSFLNLNPLAGTQESLPLFVFRYIRDPSQSSIDRGFAGGLMLMIIVLTLFGLARAIGRDRSQARNRRRGARHRRQLVAASTPPPAPQREVSRRD